MSLILYNTHLYGGQYGVYQREGPIRLVTLRKTEVLRVTARGTIYNHLLLQWLWSRTNPLDQDYNCTNDFSFNYQHFTMDRIYWCVTACHWMIHYWRAYQRTRWSKRTSITETGLPTNGCDRTRGSADSNANLYSIYSDTNTMVMIIIIWCPTVITRWHFYLNLLISAVLPCVVMLPHTMTIPPPNGRRCTMQGWRKCFLCHQINPTTAVTAV